MLQNNNRQTLNPDSVRHTQNVAGLKCVRMSYPFLTPQIDSKHTNKITYKIIKKKQSTYTGLNVIAVTKS